MTGVADNSWIPPAGTHEVAIGQSLARALKARKGETVRSKVERELYSFRYNFRPESVDTVANGTLSVKKGEDKDIKVAVERLSQTDAGGHSFVGTAPPAKEFDCVITYDPQSMTFTMEKVDSCLQLNYDRKTSHGPRSAASPHPVTSAAPPRSSTSSSAPHTSQSSNRARPNQRTDDSLALLERSLDEDADGEPDGDFIDTAPAVTHAPVPSSKKNAEQDTRGKQTQATYRNAKAPTANVTISTASTRMEEEESESEVALAQSRPPPAPTPAPKVKTQGTRATQPKRSAAMLKAEKAAKSAFRSFPKPRASQLPPQPAPTPAPAPTNAASKPIPSATQSAPRTKRAREPEEQKPNSEASHAFPVPQPRPKRLKVTQPSKSTKPEKEKEPFSLALPTGSGFNLPGSLSTSSAQLAGPSSTTSTAPPQPQVSAPPADDSEEEDWDEVQPSADANASTLSSVQLSRSIQMEEIIPTASHYPDPQDDTVDATAAADQDFLHAAFMDGDEEPMEEEPAEDEQEEADFLAANLESETTAPQSEAQRPISMHELAGDNIFGDDDYTSSSSESDDD